MTSTTTDTTRVPSDWETRVRWAIQRARDEGTVMVTVRDLSVLLASADPEGVRATMDGPKTLDHYRSKVQALADGVTAVAV